MHPRPGFKHAILRAFIDGIGPKPETTFGNVKADVLDRFIPATRAPASSTSSRTPTSRSSVLVIFPQVRPHQLSPRAAVLPLAPVVVVAIIELQPFTLGGNDLALILILAATGITLGALSGPAGRVWPDERGRMLLRASAISVITWVIGMGFRFGFAYYAYHGSGPAVARSRSSTTSPVLASGRPRWS